MTGISRFRVLLGVGAISLLGAILSVLVFGQIPNENAVLVKKQKSLLQVIDSEGWPTPKLTEVEKLFMKERRFGDTLALESKYQPNERLDSVLVLFSVNEIGELFQHKKSVELRYFSSLEVSGKTFAFILDYLQYGESDSAGRMYFGPRIRIAIVDNDGDGIFETRTYYPKGEIDKIPDWVGNVKDK